MTDTGDLGVAGEEVVIMTFDGVGSGVLVEPRHPDIFVQVTKNGVFTWGGTEVVARVADALTAGGFPEDAIAFQAATALTPGKETFVAMQYVHVT